jgi:hypothetical protein
MRTFATRRRRKFPIYEKNGGFRFQLRKPLFFCMSDHSSLAGIAHAAPARKGKNLLLYDASVCDSR